MDALVLAAGLGSRLRGAEPSKPLTRIGGVSLLEIACAQLAAAGAQRIVVATGYLGAMVEDALGEIAGRIAVPVLARRVTDYSKPNGHSILDAADALGDDFLLVMADHVFSREILLGLAAEPARKTGVVLAIDRRMQSDLIDPDDATWVQTARDGRIMHIGKQIERFNAVDCGAFRASGALVEAIAAAIREGKPGSLSDGMQHLADRGRAYTREIGEAWWIDVDEPVSLALAREQAPAQLPEIFGTAAVSLPGVATMVNAA